MANRPHPKRAFSDNYRAAMAVLVLLFCSLAGQAQTITNSNPGSYGVGYHRIPIDSTLYFPTGCGVPSGIASLNSYGFTGFGQKIRQAAIYADTCGKHVYWFNWTDSSWRKLDTLGGGGTGSADSLKHLFVDTSASPRNGYYLGFDSVNRKWKLYSTPFYDSTVMQTKYRSDTSRTNVYAAINSKLASVSSANTIQGNGTSASPLQLAGDVASPGNSYYYGTNGSGAKGYNPLPSGVAGANPSALIGLAPVNGVATTFMRSDAAPSIDTNGTNIHTNGYNDARYLKIVDSAGKWVGSISFNATKDSLVYYKGTTRYAVILPSDTVNYIFASATTGNRYLASYTQTNFTTNVKFYPVRDTTTNYFGWAPDSALILPFSAKVTNLGASTGIKAGAFLSRPSAANSQSYYWSTDSAFWSYDGAGPAWKDLKPGSSSSGFTNPMTSVNDIIIGGTGGSPQRLATGANNTVFHGGGTYSAVNYATDGIGLLPIANVGPWTNWPAQLPYGFVYNKSIWYNDADFLPNASGTATVNTTSTGVTTMTATSINWSNTIAMLPNRPTLLNDWTDTLEIKLLFTPSSGTTGMGPCILSLNTVSDNSVKIYLNTSNSGNGTLHLANASGTDYNSATGCTNTLNDIIRFVVRMKDSTITVQAFNVTTGVQTTAISDTFKTSIAGPFIPNIANWGMVIHGTGSYQLMRRIITSGATRYPNILFAFDSKGFVGANSFNTGLQHKSNNSYPVTTFYSGGGNNTTDFLSLKDEILALDAQQIVFGVASNDSSQGISLATTENNIITIDNWFKGRPTKVYWTIFPEDTTTGVPHGIGLTARKNWMVSYFGARYIDCWTAMTGGTGNVVLSSMINTDKVHPNQLGYDTAWNHISPKLTTLDPNRRSAYAVNSRGLLVIADSVGLPYDVDRIKYNIPMFDDSLNLRASEVYDDRAKIIISPNKTKAPAAQSVTKLQVDGRIESFGPNSGYYVIDASNPGTFFFIGANSGQGYFGSGGNLFNYMNMTTGNWQFVNAGSVNASKSFTALYVKRDITYSTNVDDGLAAGITIDSLSATLNSTGPWANRQAFSVAAMKITAASAQNVTQSQAGVIDAPYSAGSTVLLNNATLRFRSAPAKYWANYGSLFDSRSLTDKGYVDSAIMANLSSFTSGIYLPSIANSSNAASITSDSAVWSRIGNSMSVDGHVTITPTSGTVNTIVNITVPVNSQLAGGHAAWGNGMTSQTTNGGIGAVVFPAGSANTVSLTIYQTGQTTAFQVYYHYQYRVQ